jgi:hypothetical protein
MSKIYIFGPVNSGSNLINKIITKCQCVNKITLKPIINNEDCQNTNSYIWKHILKINDFQQIINNPNNIVIFMYKNVYNWIASIQKEAYDITFKTFDKTEPLNNNVVLKNSRFNYNHTFGNIIHLYNLYYFNYMKLLNNHPTNAIFLDYYKVIDKSTSYEYINAQINKINITILNNQQLKHILDSPSKNHGKSVNNSKEALLNYDHVTNSIKQYLVDKTKIHNYINNDIINYFENDNIVTYFENDNIVT